MNRLPEPHRGRGRRTRTTLATAGTAAVAAQLVPWVHTLLTVLVAASWTLIGLVVARALARRYGLSLPAWLSIPAAAQVLIRLAGWLRASRRAAVSPPVAAEQDCYELAGGPVMSSAVGEQ